MSSRVAKRGYTSNELLVSHDEIASKYVRFSLTPVFVHNGKIVVGLACLLCWLIKGCVSLKHSSVLILRPVNIEMIDLCS